MDKLMRAYIGLTAEELIRLNGSAGEQTTPEAKLETVRHTPQEKI